eukprot:SAG31_NODE_192_length_20788_cov_8.938083_2_plen_84_part_00
MGDLQTYAEAITAVMSDRNRELNQYLQIETINQFIGLFTCNMLLADHAVVSCFKADNGAKLPSDDFKESETTANPSAEEDERE